MCRLLMSFVFFGAVLSGTSTTTLNFIYRFRNIWFAASRVDGSSINGTVTSAARGHFWFAAFVPILLVSTIIGTFYSTLYVHSFMAECKAYFGRWIFLPWLWLLLECGMQWDWVRTFYGFESMYREDLNKEYAASNKLHNKKELTPTIGRPWYVHIWPHAIHTDDICLLACKVASDLEVCSHPRPDHYLVRHGAWDYVASSMCLGGRAACVLYHFCS